MTVSRTVRTGRSSRTPISSVSLASWAGALTSGSSTGICNPPSVARSGLATGRLFGEILGDEEARFAAAHDVEVAIAIQILHGDLHAAAPAPALIHDVADSLGGRVPALSILVPIQTPRITLSGVVSRGRHVEPCGH